MADGCSFLDLVLSDEPMNVGYEEDYEKKKAAAREEEKLRKAEREKERRRWEPVEFRPFYGAERWKKLVKGSRSRRNEEAEAAYAKEWKESVKESRRRLKEEDPFFEYEAKRGCHVYTRFTFFHHPISHLDQETHLGPMRHTNADDVHDSVVLSRSVNIFSVRIVDSDVGYPINLYGTVIARDVLDNFKSVYLFRRDRDDCQLINSKDEPLTLTGPTRGLALCSIIYFEINLKIKDDQHSKDGEFGKGLLELENLKIKDDKHSEDREFSKGLVTLDGNRVRAYDIVGSKTLPSKLSTVELTYVALKAVVEGMIEIKILNGLAAFEGKITTRTTSTQEDFLLYDSKKGSLIVVGDDGIVRLLRRVVVVSLKDMLEFYVDAYVGDRNTNRRIDFTPRLKGGDVAEIGCGVYELEVMVTWSIL